MLEVLQADGDNDIGKSIPCRANISVWCGILTNHCFRKEFPQRLYIAITVQKWINTNYPYPLYSLTYRFYSVP